jgi:fumarylacetoacetase
MSGMAMPPNFYHSPIAYNGRPSSVIASGTDIPIPLGMRKNEKGDPEFLPSAMLDYELEFGIIISKPVPFGKRITADEASGHVFGFVLINDWSARDIQFYESFPAGPFNSKSFATSMSPWVIVPEALEFAKARPLHQEMDKAPVHLRHSSLEDTIYDVDVQAYVGSKYDSPILLHVSFKDSSANSLQGMANRVTRSR